MENGHLIISDVDGTLLGDDAAAHVATEKLAQWYHDHRDRVRLVYSSGRLVSSVLESVETTPLPLPDAIIGGVGTQIRQFPGGTPVGTWPEDCEHWHPARLCSVLMEFSDLELQPAEFLSEHKISCYLYDASSKLLREISERLRVATGAEVELVYSSNRDLDILPRGANKGTAARYLATQWSYADDHVIVCGDSGNDLAMFQQGFRGIVVGNAHPELKALNSAAVYQAEKPCAAGVLEGLAHWVGV